jgi:DNA polymerase III delta subunit
MLFNGPIWEFSQQLKKFPEKPGVYVLRSEVPYFTHLITKNFNPKFKNERAVKVGSELTTPWIEETFYNYSLFENYKNLLVLDAFTLSLPVLEELLKAQEKRPDFCVVFLSEKALKNEAALKKDARVNWIGIEAPKFWQTNELFNYLINSMSLQLRPEIKNYLLEAKGSDATELYQALSVLQANSEMINDLARIKELIPNEHVDVFALAQLFCQKKTKYFFNEVIKKENNFESLRQLFGFMQGHLLKLLKAEDLKQKAKPNQYEKQIIEARKLWNDQDISKQILFFARLEVEAKKRSTTLIHYLRLYALK